MHKPRPGILFLVLWGLFLTGSVMVYLTWLQPSRLGKTISDTLSTSLGVRCDMRQVDMTLFPQPAIVVHDLNLPPGEVDGLVFRAEQCQAQLSWLSILNFRPVIRSITVKEPVVDLVWPLPQRQPSFAPAQREVPSSAPKPLPRLPRFLTGMKVELENGILRLRTHEKAETRLTDINGTARLPGLFQGRGELSIARSEFHFPGVPTVTVSDLSVKAGSVRSAKNGDFKGRFTLSAHMQMASLETPERPIKPEYRYFPLPEPAHVALELDINARPWQRLFTLAGLADIKAVLPMNGYHTPVRLTAPFTMSSPDTARLEGLHLNMDGNQLTVHGELTGLTEGNPSLGGQAAVRHFSLVRWFGFARKMPAGLQIALNDISGTMDFVLTPSGLTVSRLDAEIPGLALKGSGGCPSFQEPDVLITGHLGKANLNRLFPEINGANPPKPHLPPPAIPLGLPDDLPPKVGYDIHLTADNAEIWKLAVGDLDCHIIPVQSPKRSSGRPPLFRPEYAILSGKSLKNKTSQGVLLSIRIGDIYGGKAESHVHLDDTCRVTAAIRNAAADKALTRIAGFSALTGSLSTDADMTFIGNSAGQLVGTLAGTANATVRRGSFQNRKKVKLPFEQCTLTAQFKARPDKGKIPTALPSHMPYSGQWDVKIDTKDWFATGKGPAVITFSMDNGLPVRMSEQPLDFTLRLDKDGPGLGLWPADLNLAFKAQTSFNLDKGTVTLANLSGGRHDLTVNGTLNARDLFETPVFEGHVGLKTQHLRSLADSLGLSLPQPRNPAMLTYLNADMNIRQTINAGEMFSLNINELQGQLDQTAFQGSIDAMLGQRPFWLFNLSFDHLDLDAYATETSTNTSKALPIEFLLKHDMEGKLRGQSLILLSTPAKDLNMAFSLKKGNLHTDVFSASFPGGGKLAGVLHSQTVQNGTEAGYLKANAQLRLQTVNLLPLTTARGQKTLMAGTADAQFDLQSTLRQWGELPLALNGNWSFAIVDGSISSAESPNPITPKPAPKADSLRKNNRTSGSRSAPSGQTSFSSLSASGTITKGVVQTGNFVMKGGAFSVTGKGSIDLNTKTINAHATATVLGVPEIPIKITGPLDKPDMDYQLIGAIAGTIGNIGGTVLDLVGGVLTAPFRLFEKKTIK